MSANTFINGFRYCSLQYWLGYHYFAMKRTIGNRRWNLFACWSNLHWRTKSHLYLFNLRLLYTKKNLRLIDTVKLKIYMHLTIMCTKLKFYADFSTKYIFVPSSWQTREKSHSAWPSPFFTLNSSFMETFKH